MGSTCASFHILWRGSAADAAKAISRAYVKLGYERAKTAPAAQSPSKCNRMGITLALC